MPFDGSPPFADTHLARSLAKLAPVLVVDLPKAIHRSPRRVRPRLRPLRGAPTESWVLEPVALPANERSATAWASDAWLAVQIERAARRVLPANRVLVTLNPTRGMLPGIRRRATVYWRRDLAAHHRYAASVGLVRARSDALVRRAQLVTAVSPQLVSESRTANRQSYLVQNGSDLDHFGRSPTVRPRALPVAEGRPVLGYVGAVSWRLDHDLLARICAARPDWSVVLVGPVEGKLPQAPNLHAVGAIPYDELPEWTQAFDVGIVPYNQDEFNRASFPLKVFDYLASGVPVVSTALPALSDLGPTVRLARNAEEFTEETAALLADMPSAAECRTLAAANSWDNRASCLLELIAQLDVPGQMRLAQEPADAPSAYSAT